MGRVSRTSDQPVKIDVGPFEEDASSVLRSARGALTDLLVDAGLAGARASDIARRLDIDKTLAWKVARFIGDEDALSAYRHLPGVAGVELVIKAAKGVGAADDRVEAARAADKRLREFVASSAGDRQTFGVMVSANAGDQRTEMEQWRAMFRAASAIWGVRARVQFLTLFIYPSVTKADSLDVVQIGGLVDLERLRPDVPWIVRRLRASDDSGSTMYDLKRQPLDPSGSRDGSAPLLPAYCSSPLPELRQFVGSNGWLYDEIAPGPVGRKGAVTCVIGEIHRAALPSAWSEDNTRGNYTVTVRTPTESAMFDIYLHRSLTHFGEPETRVMGLLEERPSWGEAEHLATLRGPGPVRRLGSPPVVASTRMRNYAKLIEDAVAQAELGGLDQFRGYRVELEHPPTPCEIAMTFPISPPGGS